MHCEQCSVLVSHSPYDFLRFRFVVLLVLWQFVICFWFTQTVTTTSNYNGTPLQYTKLSSHCALVPVYIGTYSHSDIRNFRVDSESYKRTNLTYWWFVLILSIIFLLRELTRHCCWKTDLAKILANVNVSMTKNFSLRTLFVLLDAIKKYSRLNFNIS